MQISPRPFNSLSLLIQISQSSPSDILSLERNALTLLQSSGTALQTISTGQKLLSLINVLILGVWLVCVSVSE
jgi:hypothetical protein